MSYYFEKKRQDICAGLVQYTQTDTKKNSKNYFPSALKKERCMKTVSWHKNLAHCITQRESSLCSACVHELHWVARYLLEIHNLLYLQPLSCANVGF